MLYLRTGVPGAGKTLFTLHEVRERAKREKRAVYYAGIEILKPELFPEWEVLEKPDKWFELPDGAIIVHDECQSLYRPRGTGAQVPEYVARLERHRHHGWDIYLITQHPMLVDANVRRLTGEHSHVMRAFGSGIATIHRWQNKVHEQCDKTRAGSEEETKAYPRELYGAYKSATIHTHKRRIPARLWLAMSLPFILAALVWWLWSWVQDKQAGPDVERQVAAQQQQTIAGMESFEHQQQRRVVSRKTKAEWVEEHQPRIGGLAHTAPVYDRITQPVRAPYPAGCVIWPGQGCRCYTQQATRMDMPRHMCETIVATGYFVSWEMDDSRRGGTDAQRRPDAPRLD